MSHYSNQDYTRECLAYMLSHPDILVDDASYNFIEQDFSNNLHWIIYTVIKHLAQQGAQYISPADIITYLEDGHPKSKALFDELKGDSFLADISKINCHYGIDYNYGMAKKLSLLKAYDESGIDVTDILDTSYLDKAEEHEACMKRLEKMSLNELADLVESKVEKVRATLIDGFTNDSIQAGAGAKKLLDGLAEEPIIGPNLYDPTFSNIVMGARLGTMYLRSSPSGTGKSRIAMADALTLAATEYYEDGKWVSSGAQQRVLFVSVELDYDELQTMATAFLSGVNENHIIHPDLLEPEEYIRVQRALTLLEEATLWFAYLPNYNIQDIKNCLKSFIRNHHTQFIFLDYIATSMKIIEEVSKASRGMSMREDQVLHLLATELKQMAIDYHVCILTSTQTNAAAKTEKILDQNVLAGAKAIANRVDVGAVFVDCSPEDLREIMPVTGNGDYGVPNMKMSIYKNRRGQYTRLYLWIKADKGTCRYRTLFATDYNYNLIKFQDEPIEIEPNSIEIIKPEENKKEGAF